MRHCQCNFGAVVCGMSVSASADYPHPQALDPRTVRLRKCSATTSPQIDCVRNCTVITGIQSPTHNTHANEQSQSAEFYVTYKVQKSCSADALLRLHYTALRPVWCSSKCGYCGFDLLTVHIHKWFQSSGPRIIRVRRKICGSRSASGPVRSLHTTLLGVLTIYAN